MKPFDFRRLVQLTGHYGPLFTARLVASHTTARKAFAFRVPGYVSPFYARKHTSDLPVFYQVVMRDAYRLPFKPSAAPRVIVDAGANCGYASRFFAKTYPDAQVVAIEPDESNCKIIQQNVASLSRVTVHQAALWTTHTRLSISDPNAPKTAITVVEPTNGEAGTVPTLTVPELVERYGRIDILKLDIEGAEKELFEALCPATTRSWLDDVRVLIVELHDFMRAGCSSAFYAALSGRRFSQYISGENIVVRLD